jgi:uncharacterized iron-regulated membrane protein
MASRRTYFAWHSWIGLTFGLLLFVVCWSGTVAVFSHEIDWLLNSDIRANTATAPIDWQRVHDAVSAYRPDWPIGELNAPRHAGFAIEVLAQPEQDDNYRIYVDPVTYQVLGDTSYFNVQRFFRSFHMALFDVDSHFASVTIAGVPLGYLVVALMSMPLLISIITPLIFYKRWWRGFFKLERGKGTKVFLSDLHKLTGVWSMVVGFLIAITGIWYLAEWWTPEAPYYEPEQAIVAPYLPVGRLVAIAQKAKPELDIRSLYLPAANDGVFTAYGQDGSLLARYGASVIINGANGHVVETNSPAKTSLYIRWTDAADLLHFGTFAGLWSQALYFIVGLGLSGLTLTGTYLHAKRQQRKASTSIRIPVLTTYIFTCALLVFAIIGGYSEIKAYGIGEKWPEISLGVALFITAWCVSTLLALTWWVRALENKARIVS